MAPKIIGSYADLDQSLFFQILEKFRHTLSELKSTRPHDLELQNVEVRDWDLEDHDGRRCVQVFLEKIQDGLESPINLNDCIKVHKWFLNSGNFEIFEDGVDIEMGSCGTQPRLREAQHFKNYVGQEATYHFWRETSSSQPLPNDGLYSIESIDPIQAAIALRCPTSGENFLVELKKIRSASVNPPTPLSNGKKINKHTVKPSSKKAKSQPSSPNLSNCE